MRLIKETHIKFMDQRRFAFVLSAVVILAGLGSLVFQGGPKLSIDFKGGTMIVVTFNEDADITQVRSSLSLVAVEGQTFDLSKEEIKSFGDPSNISIRISHHENEPENFAQSVINHIYESFPEHVPPEAKDFILAMEKVGPKIGSELRGKAIMAIISALALILLYISIRFEFKFALGAIAALVHDIVVTVGIFSILGYEISLSIIAAFLTIVGYSLNDTIVIFDRIRENVKKRQRESYAETVDYSINQSLSRTVITSLTSFLVVLILWLFGGEVIHGFAFAMIIGVVVGTYSSIYVASPIVVQLHASTPTK